MYRQRLVMLASEEARRKHQQDTRDAHGQGPTDGLAVERRGLQ
jgi:hypothetical protein